MTIQVHRKCLSNGTKHLHIKFSFEHVGIIFTIQVAIKSMNGNISDDFTLDFTIELFFFFLLNLKNNVIEKYFSQRVQTIFRNVQTMIEWKNLIINGTKK